MADSREELWLRDEFVLVRDLYVHQGKRPSLDVRQALDDPLRSFRAQPEPTPMDAGCSSASCWSHGGWYVVVHDHAGQQHPVVREMAGSARDQPFILGQNPVSA